MAETQPISIPELEPEQQSKESQNIRNLAELKEYIIEQQTKRAKSNKVDDLNFQVINPDHILKKDWEAYKKTKSNKWHEEDLENYLILTWNEETEKDKHISRTTFASLLKDGKL